MYVKQKIAVTPNIRVESSWQEKKTCFLIPSECLYERIRDYLVIQQQQLVLAHWCVLSCVLFCNSFNQCAPLAAFQTWWWWWYAWNMVFFSWRKNVRIPLFFCFTKFQLMIRPACNMFHIIKIVTWSFLNESVPDNFLLCHYMEFVVAEIQQV